jgi:hypothetical protein
MIVVSDTSPISNLIIIGRLDILWGVYGQVVIPPKVLSEIQALKSFGVDLADFEKSDWIEVKTPQNSLEVANLLGEINRGEAEAIVLAEELSADWLLIDERLGWRVAKRKGIMTVGLLGSLVKAKEQGIVAQIKPIIEDLRVKSGFWVGEKLVERVLKTVGE